MKHLHKRSCLLLSLLLLAVPLRAQDVYRAFLGGANEPMAVPSPATGALTLILTDDELAISGTFEGLTSKLSLVAGTGTHIHLGYPGQAGAVVLTLRADVADDSLSGRFEAAANTFTLSETQLAALRARRMYANIHSAKYPGGELRGQVVPTPLGFTELYRANLFGGNEVPAVLSSANGSVIIEHVGDSIFVSGSVMKLEGDLRNVQGTPAHLHLGMAGENGAVAIGLVLENDADNRGAVLSVARNRFAVTAAQAATLAARGMYVNVHTDRHPSGELRGQVVSGRANALFRAFLSGTQERPFVTTLAGGGLVLEVMDTTVRVSGTFHGLESDLQPVAVTGFHLHTAMAGRNGDVAFTLRPALNGDRRGGTVMIDSNRVELTPAQLEVMFDRGIYANVHSQKHAGGEIRGQVVPEAQYFVQTYLSGTQEVKPVATTGTGFVVVEVRGNMMTATGSFDDLTSNFAPMVAMTGAHLHLGMAGQNGPPAFFLKPMADGDSRGGIFMADSNAFMVTAGQADTLRMRGHYLNVHSEKYPGGEVRGQLLPEANAYFVSTLSGASEVPPVMTPASGTLIGEVTATPRGDTMVRVTGSFMNLEGGFDPTVAGTGAHLHVGMAGRNGGVAVLLKSTAAAGAEMGLFMADSNMAPLDSAALMLLRGRMLYANVHSDDHPGGEIRAQMLPAANAYLMANLMGMNQVPPVMSDGAGALRMELNGMMLTVTGSFQNLDSNYAAEIGSHLHAGRADTNGNVVVGLKPTLAVDSLAAVYHADSNSFAVTAGIIDTLLSGGHYANVHSRKYPSGELRGQVLKESNFYPAAAMITSPDDEAALTIEGEGGTAFTVTWDKATDPDGNLVVYLWQLAASPTFAAPLVSANVGTDTSFTASYTTLDGLLAGAGVALDGEVMLYHRVITSDGSLLTPDSDSLTVTLKRGTVTDVRDYLSNEVRLYPSPSRGNMTLRIDALRGGEAQVRVSDLMGRMVITDNWRLTAGENLRTLRLESQPAGVYMVTMTIDGQPLPGRKVVKQ